VELLRDPNEFAVDERLTDCLARAREVGYLEQDLIAEANPRSRNDQIPIDPCNGYVLARGSHIDRVSLTLKGTNSFQRIHAHGSVRSAVVYLVVVSVV
jgi:hypothetical protein